MTNKTFGPYEVLGELGRGGMGVVYEAWDESLNRKIAIKVLSDQLADNPEVVERFKREAKSMAALNDRHIIQIYSISEYQGQPYFVMEFVDGESLGQRLKRDGKLSLNQAKQILEQTAVGLSVAHDRGVIHRDIKPGNLMITQSGEVKIADFGIAMTQDFGERLTTTGEFVGTPGYLSPEVCTGEVVDQRSDIFALGIVFYEMLTGDLPFTDASPLGMMLEVVKAEIPDIRTINSEVDDLTYRTLRKMIAKDVNERYQTCRDLLTELHLSVPTGQASTIATPVSHSAPTLMSHTDPSVQMPQPGQLVQHDPEPEVVAQRSVKPFLMMAAAVMMMCAVGGWFGYQEWRKTDTENNDRINVVKPIAEDSDNQPDMTDLPATGGSSTISDAELDEARMSSVQSDLNNVPELPDTTGVGFVQDRQKPGIDDQVEPGLDIAEISDLALAETIINETEAVGSTIKTVQAPEQESLTPEYELELQKIGSNESQAVGSTVKTVQAEVREGLTPEYESQLQKIEPKIVSKYGVAANDQESEEIRLANVLQPEQPKRELPPRTPRIVVVVVGDPAITLPLEQQLIEVLESENHDILDAEFIPGLADIASSGRADIGDMTELIQNYGGDVLVLADVQYLGETPLYYHGQTSLLYSVNLKLRNYLLAERRRLGKGWQSKIDFSNLNAEEKAREALEPMMDEFTASLSRLLIAERG